MANADVLAKVKNLPKSPGCYLFKSDSGEIIYVGKAKNLKNRVSSYFQSGIEFGSKTYSLVQRINDINVVEAASELEAFILEAELIKKHRPKYNIDLKDDKSYLYIVIRNEQTLIGRIEKVITCRKTDLKEGDDVFGPYPDGTTAKLIVKTIRKFFPFRDCQPTKFSRYHKLGKKCLFGDLGLCGGPCVESDLTSYKKNIDRVTKLLSGEGSAVLNNLKAQMKLHAQKKEYEAATKYRDLIAKFEYVRQHFHSAQSYLDNPNLVEDLTNQSLESLVLAIPALKKTPLRIECYDISNISGKDAVGSMVVATNGRMNNKEYRRFKIKLKKTPDDFEMMREVLRRRLAREKSKDAKWETPDLIVVDGGKGQISAVLEVMDELSLNTPVVGLAKKQETLIYKTDEAFIETTLEKDHSGLKLLIQLRDESHRFAQDYHHALRSKSLLSNV